MGHGLDWFFDIDITIYLGTQRFTTYKHYSKYHIRLKLKTLTYIIVIIIVIIVLYNWLKNYTKIKTTHLDKRLGTSFYYVQAINNER